MIPLTTLQEWKSLPTTSENAELLGVFVRECWDNQELDTFWEMSLLLSDMYAYLQDHGNALSVLEELYSKNVTEDQKKLLVLIDKEIALFLKTEDFDKLQALLKTRSRYAEGNPHQEAMQQFYLSVSLEGLKQEKDALEALLSIPDNMSSANQVSKYLKCSMLSLKLNQVGEARHYYEKALLFDSQRKNPIFHLVLSDMALATGKLQQALDEFEQYFLKSKIKSRYLDRYLILCEKSDRLDEGKAFYELYRDSMLKSNAKSSKQAFFEAALSLFERIRDKEEMTRIRRYLNESLSSEELPEIAFFGYYHELSMRLAILQSFSDRRDLFLRMSRVLGDFVELKRLYFMVHEEKGVLGYVFSKSLLLERHVSDSEVMNSSFSSIAYATQEPKLLFSGDAILKDDELGGFLVSIPSVDAPSVAILATFSNREKYDRIHKLLFAFTVALQARLLDLDEKLNHMELVSTPDIIASTYSIGTLRIDGPRAVNCNKVVQDWFQLTGESCEVDTLLACFSPRLFVDDFLNQKKRIVEMTKNDTHFTFELSPHVSGTSIHLYMRKVEIAVSEPTQKSISIQEVIENATANYSVMIFRFADVFEGKHILSLERLNAYEQSLQELPNIAEGKYVSRESLGIGIEAVCFETTDKRVLSRIDRDFVEEITKLTKSVELVKLISTFVTMTKKTNYTSLIDDLLRENSRQVEGLVFVERATLNQNRLATEWINEMAKNKFQSLFFSKTDIVTVQNNAKSTSVLFVDCPPHLDELSFERAMQESLFCWDIDELAIKKILMQLSLNSEHEFLWNVITRPSLFLRRFDSLYKKLQKLNAVSRLKLVFSLKGATLDFLNELTEKYPLISFGIRDMEDCSLTDLSLIPKESTWVVCEKTLEFLRLLDWNHLDILYVHQGETLRKSTLEQLGIHAYYSSKMERIPITQTS